MLTEQHRKDIESGKLSAAMIADDVDPEAVCKLLAHSLAKAAAEKRERELLAILSQTK